MSKTIKLPATRSIAPNYTVTIDCEAFCLFAAALTPNSREVPTGKWLDTGLLAFNERGVVEITPRGEDLLASAHLIPDDPEPVQPVDEPCDGCNGTGEQALFMSTHVCDVCKGSRVKKRNVSSSFKGLVKLFHGPYVAFDYTQRDIKYVAVYPTRENSEHYSPPAMQHTTGGTLNVPYGRFCGAQDSVPEAPRRGPVSVVDGWVRIDSADAAKPFIGERVEICAEGPRGALQTHDLHGRVRKLISVNDGELLFAHDPARPGFSACIGWRIRGNIRLRLAGVDHE